MAREFGREQARNRGSRRDTGGGVASKMDSDSEQFCSKLPDGR